MKFRIGQGTDIHRLVEGRKLILGGVEIPWEKGLLGHSDADVVCHALSNALLGAIGAGDIGRHFPDSDPRYKGASSTELLRVVMGLVKERGYRVGNADLTILAEKPKLGPYREEMRKNLAVAFTMFMKSEFGRAILNRLTHICLHNPMNCTYRPSRHL